MRYSKKKYHGGNKPSTFFKPRLGHPWTHNVASWPGISQQSTSSCNGITQSNHYRLNNLGMGPGLPIATNTLHGGQVMRKNTRKRRSTKHMQRKNKRKNKRKNNHKTKQKRHKQKHRTTKKKLHGGSMTRLFPESIVNWTRSAMSLPFKLSNIWRGRSQPISLDPYPFRQPIGNKSNPYLNIGYKLTPKDIQSMAADKTFT